MIAVYKSHSDNLTVSLKAERFYDKKVKYHVLACNEKGDYTHVEKLRMCFRIVYGCMKTTVRAHGIGVFRCAVRQKRFTGASLIPRSRVKLTSFE